MFRNKEIRRFAVIFLIITGAAAAAGFSVSRESGLLILITAAAFGTAFFIFTRIRYRKLAELADQIDLVLHDDDGICIAELDEGELSILQNEIAKMTTRLNEQNAALRQEKVNLADSQADIAHQLRTPLTSANLVLSLLKNEDDPVRRKILIRENEELFAQMDRLITSLLKLSRLDAGIIEFQNEPVNVKELMDMALRPLLIPMDLHDITLRTELPDRMIIDCDAGWLSEAVRNLVKNSMESAGDSGTIDILCSDNPLYGEITIHDSGRGFGNEELSHLFERFYRGENSAVSGYGIGMALCRSIIIRQGGTVSAGNHPEGGALFRIRFPK